MADSNIGALPQATQLDDDSLMVAEQQGQAMKVTGAQFKEFGRQAVVTQVQGLVDEAQAAANQAVSAVSSVTDMTVEAHPSEAATVTKSTKNGKVNLDFGLPQGEKGEPGPQGEQGPRGPQGAPGNGLKILGYYDTLDALRAAQTAPNVGDAYGIGTEPPYNIYVFDGVTMDWKDNGQLSGGGGTILPENVVTTPGGAEMTFTNGDGPHTISFDFEEEPPLTAEDVTYSDTQNVKEAIDGLFTSVSDGKALIASAITDKGVPTQQDAAFSEMAANIGQITTGGDTSDATATPGDILAGKTAYTATGKVEGIIPTLEAKTYTPGTAAQTIANGQYLGGTQTIQGDTNLTSSNIKAGVSIFGVAGAMEQNFLATLTVKADTGAVVTATHTDGTKVEALSTNGQVVLELPIEGTWKVTAVRGMAQYNTVTIQVTSQYNAELTAEVHIEYFGTVSGSTEGYGRGAASIPGYALFAGGLRNGYIDNASQLDTVYAYSENLELTRLEELGAARGYLAGASVGDCAIFAGGGSKGTYLNSPEINNADSYSADLTRVNATYVAARYEYAGTSIGEYALFGGGYISYSSGYNYSNSVYAYDTALVQSQPESGLASPCKAQAASNANYAIFAGASKVTAYDKYLTRTIAANPSLESFYSTARAGNYVVFVGDGAVDAYDLFLTRVSVPDIFRGTEGTTLNDFAVFGNYGGDVGVYDPYLALTRPESMTEVRYGLIAASVGNYAVFSGGGSKAGAITDEAYQYV